MASAVQQCVLCPLPDLSALKSNVFEEGQAGHDGLRGGGGGGGDSGSRDRDALLAAATQTPTSSSDRASERCEDPVALLSHPVEGFHHPRQHLFTDRLVGRFYEDTSLYAETRKSSKCLAGRLGTAGSNTTTRPNTTVGGAAPLLRSRSSHSPTAARCGRRMLGGASAHSQGLMSKAGGGRPQAGGGVGTALSGRKEQVQKEIMEQKALIEKLEGKMASLSSRGGRSSKSDSVVHVADARRSTAAQNQEDGDDNLQDDGRGPGTTRSPQCMERATLGEGILVDSEYCSDAKVAEHGSTAGRGLDPADGCHPQSVPGNTSRRSREEDASAVVIQRNVRGAGRRKSFLLLQSAREDFVRHLQSVASAAVSLTWQTQRPKPPTTVTGSSEGSGSTSGVTRVQSVCSAAERVIETSREEGLAKPPFDTLRAMHSGMVTIEEALALLTAEVDGGGWADKMDEHVHESYAAMAESCRAARRALGVLTETVGADKDPAFGELMSACFATASPAVSRDHPSSPAGSGRAAAVAMASAREGLLISPDSSGSEGALSAVRSGTGNKQRITELRRDGDEIDESSPVPLNTVGAEGIGILLCLHGFEEHAPGFLAQAVDGVMLSDPNLCEADFAELGLGGDAAGADECRARMVTFFRRCQEQGAVVHSRGTLLLSDQAAAPSGGAAAGTSKPIIFELGDANQTNDRKQAGGETGAVADTRAAACSVTSGPGGDRVVSEPLWHRNSVQLDPQSQKIIADISVDADEGRAASASARGNGGRISVKLNGGVVVTVGGVEADLIDDADRLSGDDSDDEDTGDGSGRAPPVLQDTPPVSKPGRRTSVGFRQVTLEADPAQNGEGGTSDAGDGRLSPGLSVTTADVTLNVFSDGEFRP